MAEPKEADESKSWNGLSLDDLRAELQDNHMWLNAISCINPSEAMLREIGAWVVVKLNETELRDGMGISPTVVLRFNKS